jgi:hypothetical protein
MAWELVEILRIVIPNTVLWREESAIGLSSHEEQTTRPDFSPRSK